MARFVENPISIRHVRSISLTGGGCIPPCHAPLQDGVQAGLPAVRLKKKQSTILIALPGCTYMISGHHRRECRDEECGVKGIASGRKGFQPGYNLKKKKYPPGSWCMPDRPGHGSPSGSDKRIRNIR